MATVHLSIPAQPEHVRTVRLVASSAARRCGVDEEILDEVRLAVGEATARAVLRHRAARLGDPVKVDLSDDNDEFMVRVHERGVDDEESDGEMALALISALAPVSSLTDSTAGTVISMTWPIDPAGSIPSG